MSPRHRNAVFTFSAMSALLAARTASADAVTDWNEVTVEATKGFNGSSGAGVTVDSNLGTRIEAIEARAVFDAVNSIHEFSDASYYYSATNTGSADAAAAQAAHDVILGTLPDPSADTTVDARWAPVRAWVDQHLADHLAALGVGSSDGGVAAGHAAAAAALAARKLDNSAPVTTYGASLTPASNPGVGLWRQSNAGAVYVDPTTGVPTGFDASGVIQARSFIAASERTGVCLEPDGSSPCRRSVSNEKKSHVPSQRRARGSRSALHDCARRFCRAGSHHRAQARA